MIDGDLTMAGTPILFVGRHGEDSISFGRRHVDPRRRLVHLSTLD